VLWPTDDNGKYGMIGYNCLFNLEPNMTLPPYIPRRTTASDPDWELMADRIGWNKDVPYMTGPTNNHPRESGVPEGGNILYVDGHGAWRSFQQFDLSTYCAVNIYWKWYAW
jgi:prepilin-type processing-associated H-X9-DG protein